MIVDEKGKLFGKINLLDLLLILIILAAFTAAGIYFLGGGTLKAEKTVPIVYTVEIKNKDLEYFDHLVAGEQVISGITKEKMGKIKAVTVTEAQNITQADDALILSTTEGKHDGRVQIEADASLTYPDLMLGNEDVKIGLSVALRSESAAMHGYIIDVDYDKDALKEAK